MFRNILVFAILLGTLSSCSNDFDVTAPFKDIPIVYALLSKSDTAHYIRIEKAFLDPKTNAYQLAKVADSLYYPNTEVSLIDIASGDEFKLVKVDGNFEGYPREDGVFATSPNYLYKIKANAINLKAGAVYKLLIKPNFSDLVEATATTTILKNFTISSPAANASLKLDNYFKNIRVEWDDDKNAYLYNVSATYYYQETEPGGVVFQDKQKVQIIVKDLPRNPSALPDYDFAIGDLYKFLGGVLVVDPTIRRKFQSISIRVVAGGKEFNDIRLINVANSGLTGAQALPTYSNIKNGLGIFSSRSTAQVDNITFHPVSLDSLRNGIYTKLLGFE